MKDKSEIIIKRTKYNAFDASKVFLFSLIIPEVTILAGMILSTIVLALMGKDIDAISKTMGYSVFLLLLSNLTLFLICYLYNKGNDIDGRQAMHLQKKKFDYKIILFLLLLSVVAIIFSAPFINVCDEFFAWLGYKSSSAIAISMDNWWQVILCIIVLAVIPAITEEMVYRGVVQNGLANTMGKKALVITALCFTLMHGVINQTLYQFIIGLVLCIVAYVTGSLVYSIILHFFNNAFVLILSFVGQYVNINFLPVPRGWEIALSIVMFVVGVGLIALILWWLISYIKKSKVKAINNAGECENDTLQVNASQDNMKRPLSRREQIYLIAGIAIACVIWIYNTVIGFLG